MTKNTLFHDYEGFVEKFKPKRTTDDCYTPEPIYDAVLAYVREHCGIEGKRVLRPFYPGGDFMSEDYGPDTVVVDNPPFSILSKIARWYAHHGVKYFLFAPTLTLFGLIAADPKATAIVVGATVTYENGAEVNTSFVTNMMPGDFVAVCDPGLFDALAVANKQPSKQQRKINWPIHVCNAALLSRLPKHGTPLRIPRRQAALIKEMDNGHQIFGTGLLLSERAAAERAAAERAAAERAAAAKADLSDREKDLIKLLSMNDHETSD